jgi:hypothetical protein
MAMSILPQNLIPLEQVSQYHGESMTNGANNINDYTQGGLPEQHMYHPQIPMLDSIEQAA